MRSAQYWKRRAEGTLLAAELQGNDLVERLREFYSETERQILRDVEAFYGRYAQDNKITIQEARQRLTAPQLLSFREELECYYAEAKRLGLGKDYQDYLRRLSGRGYVSRQEELLVQVRHQVEVLANRELESFLGTLTDVYEDSFYRSVFSTFQGMGFGWDLNRLDAAQVEAIIRRPWLGSSFSDRIWKHKGDLLQKLDQYIPRAFAVGEGSRELGRQLARVMGTSRHNAERLVRTEVNHAAAEATRASYRELGVEEYDFLATLELNTCELCGALDGQTYQLSQAQTGVNYPPIHPHCRCTSVPRVKKGRSSKSTRAAYDKEGNYYTVPEGLTYEQWRRQLNAQS